MCPLQRPWPSPPADVGIRVLVPVTAANLKVLKNFIFFKNDYYIHFTYILSLLLCPVPCLHFYCSLCLET
ncbi:unnamed protein product [Staurois parvus]|uniref:Uncharacterized protein n=1 Tax=Staurois parvus TaxID=386267 RepID=A0ABN9GQE5_9NEOB|nr:unnamed protein product [Staurois parvus]